MNAGPRFRRSASRRRGTKILAISVVLLLVPPAAADALLLTQPTIRHPFVPRDGPDLRPLVRSAGPAIGPDAPWWEGTSRDLDRNRIADPLDRTISESPTSPVSPFVTYGTGPTPADVGRLTVAGYTVIGTFEFIGVAQLAPVPAGDLPPLLRLPGVVFLDGQGVPTLLSDIATPAARAKQSAEYSPNTSWELGATGKGQVIAMMDTGSDNAHPSLAGKWLGGADISKPESPLWPRDGTFDADDTQGHGTTTSGIAMGTGAPDGTYQGTAPDARLVDLRIGTIIGYAPGEGPGSFYDASLQATQWAIDHHADQWPTGAPDYLGIDILSLSWEVDVGGNSDGSDPYSRALDRLVDTNVTVCIAAGNSGPDNNGFQGMGAASKVITIGSTDDQDSIFRGDDLIADYSSRGPRADNGDGYPYDELKPDISAPGTGITQAEFDRVGDGSGNGYGPRGSGTSYATPLIAGVVADLREANGNLTPALSKEILRFTAERRGNATFPDLDPYWNKDYGWGIVDAFRAVEVAMAIDDVDAIDIELQAFITNVTVTPSSIGVEGISWARVGNVEEVRYRVDGGAWVRARDEENGTWAKWGAAIDPARLGLGNHTIDVAAFAGDKHSLIDNRTVTITRVAPPTGAAFPWQLGLILLLVAGAAVIVVFRQRLGLGRLMGGVRSRLPGPFSVPKPPIVPGR